MLNALSIFKLSEGSDILPAALAAEYAKVKPATLRMWARRSDRTGVHHHPGGYSRAELVAWLANRDSRKVRTRRAVGGP